MENKIYLSKRENDTYSIISNGCSVNQYTTKENCVALAKRFRIELPNEVWSARDGCFILENN